MSSKERSWKESLLNSGLLFEHTIQNSIKDYGITVHGEYSYERMRERGEEKVSCSVDIYGVGGNTYNMKDRTKKPYTISHNYFIECKYEHDGNKYLFLPELQTVRDNSENCILRRGTLFPEHFFNSKFRPESIVGLSKGTLVRKNKNDKADEHRIRNAIRQSCLSMLDLFALAFVSETRESGAKIIGDNRGDLIEFFHPIIITNAELFRLKDGKTNDDLRNCGKDDIDNLFEPIDCGLIYFYTLSYMHSFLLESIERYSKISQKNIKQGDISKKIL